MVAADELIEDYWPFKFRKPSAKNLSYALKDVNISSVGVSGMGGVGKNTFSKEVGRKAIEYLLKVFVEVSETPDLEMIQRASSQELDLERLIKSNKILLILDDVWNDLDLRTVGIPSIAWRIFRKTPGDVIESPGMIYARM